jgi:hypothetical protein
LSETNGVIHVKKEPAVRLRTGFEISPYMQRIDLIPGVLLWAAIRKMAFRERPLSMTAIRAARAGATAFACCKAGAPLSSRARGAAAFSSCAVSTRCRS